MAAKELQKCLNEACNYLNAVHESVALYIEKPVYGRLLSDLEKKQAEYLELLESIEKEKAKCVNFTKELELWSGNLLHLMWKEQGQSINSRLKSVKELKKWKE